MKRSSRFLLALGTSLALFAGVVGTAGPAAAAPPPPGYPTSQIITTAFHPNLGAISIRRGFYDSYVDRGFGYDKAYHKHNIWSSTAMRRIMSSPNYVKKWNGTYELTSYAGKYDCDGYWCKLVDQRQLTGVYDPRTYTNYYGWPVNGKLGMLTAYCHNPNLATRCPNWVTYAITNPGVDNPYLNSTNAEPVPSPATTTGSSDVSQLNTLEWTKMVEPETPQLAAEIDAGNTALNFGYEPLPKKMKNPKKK